MGFFVGEIDLQVIQGESDSWIVCQDFSYICNDGEEVIVTKGLRTDLASTPRIVWNIFPPFGLYIGAAIVHDALYTRQTFDRAKSDGIFLEAMKTEDVSWLTRQIIYRAVRIFGGFAWHQHAKEKANGG